VQRGGVYLFLPGFSSLYDAIHGWMTRWMDGWMEKASQKTITTSFSLYVKEYSSLKGLGPLGNNNSNRFIFISGLLKKIIQR
jgi:hypothetical protein